jgi:hypothetical protein
MTKLSKKSYKRMDGFVNQKAMENLTDAVLRIGRDLYEEGFEVEEINQFLKIQLNIILSNVD